MKKKLTKIAAMTMAVGMAMTSLIGCGPSDAAASGATGAAQVTTAAESTAETVNTQKQQTCSIPNVPGMLTPQVSGLNIVLKQMA